MLHRLPTRPLWVSPSWSLPPTPIPEPVGVCWRKGGSTWMCDVLQVPLWWLWPQEQGVLWRLWGDSKWPRGAALACHLVKLPCAGPHSGSTVKVWLCHPPPLGDLGLISWSSLISIASFVQWNNNGSSLIGCWESQKIITEEMGLAGCWGQWKCLTRYYCCYYYQDDVHQDD